MDQSLPSQVVVLVRHGEAKTKDVDPKKSLSEAGREHVVQVSGQVAGIGPSLEEIRHSGKVRAQQTAEVLAEVVGVAPERVREVDGLRPNDDVGAVARQVDEEGRSLALVGHLPFMGKLASLLLTGDPGRLDLRIGDAGCLILRRSEDGWRLEGFFNHDLVD
jgi:phosphohistidine phosphatase